MKVRFQVVDSILDQVESIQRRIGERAEKLFHERGGALGHALEDWVKAEQQTIRRPALEVVRTKDGFVVEAAVAGIESEAAGCAGHPHATAAARGAAAPG